MLDVTKSPSCWGLCKGRDLSPDPQTSRQLSQFLRRQVGLGMFYRPWKDCQDKKFVLTKFLLGRYRLSGVNGDKRKPVRGD